MAVIMTTQQPWRSGRALLVHEGTCGVARGALAACLRPSSPDPGSDRLPWLYRSRTSDAATLCGRAVGGGQSLPHDTGCWWLATPKNRYGIRWGRPPFGEGGTQFGTWSRCL